MDMDREQFQKELEEAKRAGENVDDVSMPPEYTVKQIRKEISKEMLFLLPPMILGAAFLSAALWWPAFHNRWQNLVLGDNWFNALLGSILGAMIGAFVVWVTRILGTLVFRKVAMGLGDVHLMFGVGAIIGAGGATVAFFVAPFFGIVTALYRLITRKGHEIPFGPYLALGTAAVMLLYCPIKNYLEPGLSGLLIVIGQLLHGRLG
jgi:prepilin signal peptidase PulO-like enzyme (type II secretory pathway)